jgi:molybdate transport system ATP-binding protein
MITVLDVTFNKEYPRGAGLSVEGMKTELGPGGVIVLFGASGSGKTTLLRCLAGLEQPDSGHIRLGDEVWFDSRRQICVPARERNLGYVPQDYALFPHLTVAQNIGYGLRSLAASEREGRCAEAIRWLGLAGMETRYPGEISGGEQQRVALGRAIVRRPRLLLLDEPLSALDAPTRQRLRNDLRQWLRKLSLPTVLVTHDRTEALTLGSRVLVMHEGQIAQNGTPRDVFNRPANLAVARLVGVETILPGRVLDRAGDLATVEAEGLRCVALAHDLPPDTRDVLVCIRAEDVILSSIGSDTTTSARNRIFATVNAVWFESPLARVELDCGPRLKALVTRQALEELDLRPGVRVQVWVKAPHVHLIPA